MHEVTIGELQQLYLNGRKATQYAADHYDELVTRKHTYTLYGPHAYRLGASIPCNTVTPRRARNLSHKTRRKDYLIYQLDEHYQVIRTIIILDYNKVDVIYHHFALDGVVYAYPSPGTMINGEIIPLSRRDALNGVLKDHIPFLRFSNGKPVSYGVVERNFIFVQFYEYINDERMLVTNYRYWPQEQHSLQGTLIDPYAPIRENTSSVLYFSHEGFPEDTDFSRWFK